MTRVSSTTPRAYGRRETTCPIGLVTGLLLSLAVAGPGCQPGAPANGDEQAEKSPASEGKGKSDAPAKPATDGLPDAATLLEESAAARGGKERFAAMESYHTEASVDMGTKLGISGVGRMWWKRGDFYGETDLRGVGKTRMGGKAGVTWMEEPINGLRTLSGKEAEQTLWSASVCLACEWQKYFTSADTVAVENKNGKKVASIKLVSKAGDAVLLLLDMETKLPVGQEFEKISPQGPMPVTVRFEDFREVEGLTLSFKQMIDAAGMVSFSHQITKFEMNVPVDEAQFAQPGSAAALDLSKKDSLAGPGADPEKEKAEAKAKAEAAKTKDAADNKAAAPAAKGKSKKGK